MNLVLHVTRDMVEWAKGNPLRCPLTLAVEKALRGRKKSPKDVVVTTRSINTNYGSCAMDRRMRSWVLDLDHGLEVETGLSLFEVKLSRS